MFMRMVLELGSGLAPHYSPDAEVVHLDKLPLHDVEIVCDLNTGIPLRADAFDEVIASDIVEHVLDVFGLMGEIHRVMKKKARLKVRTTYWKSENAYTDPSHLHFFTEHSFDYFDPNTEFGGRYSFYTKTKFRILDRHRTMDGQEQVFLLEKM